jgi:hypothetical protein
MFGRLLEGVGNLFALAVTLGRLLKRGEVDRVSKILDGELLTTAARKRAEAEAELRFVEPGE